MKKQLLFILALILLVSCDNYGEKLTFNGTDVFYKGGVTKEQATQLGNYLITNKFTNGNEKSVQFVKETKTNHLTFRMVVDESVLNDPSYDYVFESFSRNLSKEFNRPVDFNICDNTFNTLKVYLFKDLPKLVNAKATQILYTNSVTEQEAIALKNYLIESEFANDENPKTIELDKENETYIFRMVIKEGLENDENNLSLLKLFGESISKEAFNGKPLKVHLCNSNLKTLKVL